MRNREEGGEGGIGKGGKRDAEEGRREGEMSREEEREGGMREGERAVEEGG